MQRLADVDIRVSGAFRVSVADGQADASFGTLAVSHFVTNPWTVMTAICSELDPAFGVFTPPGGATVPLVFNSPHSGSIYPRAFVASSRLDLHRLRCSEDAFVNALFAAAPAHGSVLMEANFPRAYVDLNREPYELDPQMFDGPLPNNANTRSMRVAGGLGTIARIVADAEPIYARRIPVAEALMRIETFYKPYHAALNQLLADAHQRFGHAVLIDCHSMPSASAAKDDHGKCDIVLGDRYGTSCAPGLTDLVHDTLAGLGYSVARNKPYAGGFITERYGQPSAGFHALQIEINRSLYMDEIAYRPTPDFAVLKEHLTGLISALCNDEYGLAWPAFAAE